jgi:hypothetical protein
MLIAWDELALQLSEYGFLPVFYFEICCPTDGTWRLCRESWQAEQSMPCPICQHACARSPLLCRAFARQQLPKPEKLMGSLGVVAQKWLRAMEDSPVTLKVMRKPKALKLRRGWNPIYAKRPLGR